VADPHPFAHCEEERTISRMAKHEAYSRSLSAMFTHKASHSVRVCHERTWQSHKAGEHGEAREAPHRVAKYLSNIEVGVQN
jgi:hypothetical protein